MAGFGFVNNAFAYVSRKFAEAGKAFREAYQAFKGIIEKKDKLSAYRRYKEAQVFRRMEPFIERVPGGQRIPYILRTPTLARLRDKYQYMFRVTIRATGQLDGQEFFYSFLSSQDYTKNDAESLMHQRLLSHFKRAKYEEIEDLAIALTGVRQTRWVA